MYIVRWLMGHPIIAIWVLGAIAILLTLGSSQKNESNHQTGIQQGHISESTLNGITRPKVHPEKESVLTKHIESSDNTEQRPHVTEDVVNKTTTSTKENLSSAVTKNNSKNPEKEIFASEDIKPQTAANHGGKNSIQTEAASVRSEVADLGQMSTEEMLLVAREAYWNNGLDEAAQIYSQLILLEPNVIEHKGELGNVYWKQGFPKKAANLYAEIAIPMIEKGKSERVINMVGFIGLFYPDKADNIHKQIQLKQNNK